MQFVSTRLRTTVLWRVMAVVVMAVVTSAYHRPWPLDVTLQDLNAAGLPAPSLVRMKLFTLDHRLVVRKLGRLSAQDERVLQQTLRQLFK